MFDDLADCLSLTAVYMPNKNLFITPKTFIFHDFHRNLAQDQLVLGRNRSFLATYGPELG